MIGHMIGITNSLNSFLYRPFVNALSLSITMDSIFLLPTIAAQRAKFVVRHVDIHMIVNVFQVSTVLFEEDQKVRVVAYQIFRYPPYV